MSKRFLLEIEKVNRFDNVETFSAFFKFKELYLNYWKRDNYDVYGVQIKVNKFDNPAYLWFDLEISEFDKFRDMFEGLNKAFKTKTLTNLIIKTLGNNLMFSYSTDRIDFKTFDFKLFLKLKKDRENE